jgi:hypothetical protein
LILGDYVDTGAAPSGLGGFSMSKLKIEQGDWVVVCDGGKALVLQNIGDGKFLNLKTKEV